MLLRKLVVVGLAGFFSLAANIATAEDAVGPNASFVGVHDVDFSDPNQPLAGDRFALDIGAGDAPRFGLATQTPTDSFNPNFRRYEVAVVARATSDIDVAFAQSGAFGFNDDGDLERRSQGSELRLGRRLANLREQSREPQLEGSWYLFAASEDEALTWRPGGRNEFGGSSSSFALQDRVEIGDMQAGVTYESNGWQASFAYVEREYSIRTGSRRVSGEEAFTGFTLTMRH